MRLHIRHETIYRYAHAVSFSEHQLMMFPRSRHDLTLLQSKVRIEPEPLLIWSEDAAGNVVARAIFSQQADTLTITVDHDVSHLAEEYPVYWIDPLAHRFPFSYRGMDKALISPAYFGDARSTDPAVDAWLQRGQAQSSGDTLSLLNSLNEEIGSTISYRVRDEEGTQTPGRTIELASGSCRDLTELFLAAARRLGFAARAASGYLFDPGSPAGDAGATHAWCEVFLPLAGWIAFDPTQRRNGSFGLITTAVGASSSALLPVVGGYIGDANDFLTMSAEVRVSEL